MEKGLSVLEIWYLLEDEDEIIQLKTAYDFEGLSL